MIPKRNFCCFIKHRGATVFLTCLIVLILAKPAYAYLDPGTGSMILQLLLGGVAGALMVGKLYFRKIRSFIYGLFGRQHQDEDRTDEV